MSTFPLSFCFKSPARQKWNMMLSSDCNILIEIMFVEHHDMNVWSCSRLCGWRSFVSNKALVEVGSIIWNQFVIYHTYDTLNFTHRQIGEGHHERVLWLYDAKVLEGVECFTSPNNCIIANHAIQRICTIFTFKSALHLDEGAYHS